MVLNRKLAGLVRGFGSSKHCFRSPVAGRIWSDVLRGIEYIAARLPAGFEEQDPSHPIGGALLYGIIIIPCCTACRRAEGRGDPPRGGAVGNGRVGARKDAMPPGSRATRSGVMDTVLISKYPGRTAHPNSDSKFGLTD